MVVLLVALASASPPSPLLEEQREGCSRWP